MPASLYSDTLKIFSQPRQSHLFSIRRFYSLWDDFKKGRRSPSSMNKACSKGLSTKTIKARAWFQEFVGTSGDSMPHKDKVCFPACLTKRDIYKMYAQDMEHMRNPSTVSWETFRKVWEKYFSPVTIPKVWMTDSGSLGFFCLDKNILVFVAY